MRGSILLAVALALAAVPSALAAPPAHQHSGQPGSPPAAPAGPVTHGHGSHTPGNAHGQASPTHAVHFVTFVLQGTLSGYVAGTADAPGAVTISVRSSSRRGVALRGRTLTFPLSGASRVVGASAGTLADGSRGMIVLRAPGNASVAGLEVFTPRMVISQARG